MLEGQGYCLLSCQDREAAVSKAQAEGHVSGMAGGTSKNARAWRCWLRGLRRRREARAKIVDQRSGYRDWSRNRSILVRGVVRGRTNGRGLPIHVGDETIEVTVRSVVT
jgi:hypothetical protein